MTHPIQMYTDGAARGNPGPGGYGVILMSGKHHKELSQGYRRTTNYRESNSYHFEIPQTCKGCISKTKIS